jgi:hypothetical protein
MAQYRYPDFLNELRSMQFHGVFVDDTGSVTSGKHLHSERKSWVAVVVSSDYVGEVLRQMPRAIDELKIACGQPNFISPKEPPARATRRSPGHQYVCAK